MLSRTCASCRQSHVKCDGNRPCGRCLRRRQTYSCSDPPERPRWGPNNLQPVLQALPTTNHYYQPTPSPTRHSQQLSLPKQSHPYVEPLTSEYYDGSASCAYFYDFHAKHLTQEGYQRIASAAAAYHPTYQAIFSRMTSQMHAQHEEFVKNAVFEYDRVMMASTTPFCVLRRSGEFLRVNSTFSDLVGISMKRLVQKYRFFELLTEEACVNFWELVIPLYSDCSEPRSLVTRTILVRGERWHWDDQNTLTLRPSCPIQEVACTLALTVKHDAFKLPAVVAITLIPFSASTSYSTPAT